ncbi:sorting nexin-11 isoform 2-T8 [Liasis olivaceus]
MLEYQEEEELTTVRVQDPRIHNEGSWNSYVDYKIFLHTNSKAFTAKTSCVRRRYREFVWLKKQLQKNAGLVPVPELPGKSTFFAGNTDEFIEKRRQGLQQFLEKSNCGWIQENRHSALLAMQDFGSSFDGERQFVKSSTEPFPHWSDVNIDDNELESPCSEEDDHQPTELLQAGSTASSDHINN